jgi:hypothetical protein
MPQAMQPCWPGSATASGLIDFQTVLQTQRTLLTTQDSVASARGRHQLPTMCACTRRWAAAGT